MKLHIIESTLPNGVTTTRTLCETFDEGDVEFVIALIRRRGEIDVKVHEYEISSKKTRNIPDINEKTSEAPN